MIKRSREEGEEVWKKETVDFLRQLTRLIFKFFICLEEPEKAWEMLYQNEKGLSEKLGRKFYLYMAILSRKIRKYEVALTYVNLMLENKQRNKEEEKNKEVVSKREMEGEEGEGWRGEGLEERGRILLAMSRRVDGLEELRRAEKAYYRRYENCEEEIARVKQLIGEELISMRDYMGALVFLDESLAIKRSISFTTPQNLTSLYLLMGKCQIGLKNYSIAKDFLKLVLHKKEEEGGRERKEGEGSWRRKEVGGKRRDGRGRREEAEEEEKREENENKEGREERYEKGEARFLKAFLQFENNNWSSVQKNARKGLKIMKKGNEDIK